LAGVSRPGPTAYCGGCIRTPMPFSTAVNNVALTQLDCQQQTENQLLDPTSEALGRSLPMAIGSDAKADGYKARWSLDVTLLTLFRDHERVFQAGLSQQFMDLVGRGTIGTEERLRTSQEFKHHRVAGEFEFVRYVSGEI
jgi:hypothetical protein